MDSIEKMRRLNDLTKELKSHGFAESSLEAIQQANQIYGEDEVSADVKHGVIRNSPHERITNAAEAAMPQEHPKIQQLTENIDTLTKKMNEIITAINDLDARLKDIKNRPAERVIERQVVREEPKRETLSVHEESRTEPVQKPAPKQDEYATNQRTGNYETSDVAIDKMFYFGKK